MRAAALVLAGVLLAGCAVPSQAPATTASAGPSPSGPSRPAPPTATPSAATSTPSPTSPACTAEASALDLRSRVGQLIMVGVGVDLTGSQRAAITGNHLGSAIVMGATPGGVDQVAALTAKLRTLDASMLVAADQEGGLVQRLKGPGFATIPSAARQATLSDDALKAKATGWGKALSKAGVLLDLAPVADVVPKANRSANRPIAALGRGYGSDPATVSAKVEAFRAGLADAGVASALKHFPGLGAVRGNTDFAAKVVDATTTARSPLLTPFQDAVAHGADAVMVSAAYYTRIDPSRPALHSPKVIGLLRGWGFDGVVVSDDLGAAAALRSVPIGQRALRFVRAGGDLAITVDATTAGAMADGLYAAAKDDPDLETQVTASTARVLALKARLGLVHCG